MKNDRLNWFNHVWLSYIFALFESKHLRFKSSSHTCSSIANPKFYSETLQWAREEGKKTLGLTHICMFCWLAIIFGECSQSSIHQKGYEGCKPLFAGCYRWPRPHKGPKTIFVYFCLFFAYFFVYFFVYFLFTFWLLFCLLFCLLFETIWNNLKPFETIWNVWKLIYFLFTFFVYYLFTFLFTFWNNLKPF